MENQLIQLYLLVCHIYDTQSETCFQRLSNNSNPVFTDRELVTIYLFGHLQGLVEKKAIHKLIDNYWRNFFPALPAYQTFVARLNLLEPTFQTIGDTCRNNYKTTSSRKLIASLTPCPSCWRRAVTPTRPASPVTWRMSATVPAKRFTFTVCASTPERKDEAVKFSCPIKSSLNVKKQAGSESPHEATSIRDERWLEGRILTPFTLLQFLWSELRAPNKTPVLGVEPIQISKSLSL